MIDIHCHILPFMDDGAADWESALSMAADALADGIHTVVATPHHANGQYLNPAADIISAVETFRRKLEENSCPLRVLTGQEIRVNSGLLDELEQGMLLPLAQSRYILLEMPSSRVPSSMAEVCHELVIQGYVPVIAHPERNAEVAEHPDKLARLIELGALGQVTAQSVAGTFGGKLQKLSLDLCRRGLIHVVASDAHDSLRRPFGLSEAFRVIEKELGAAAGEFFRGNAELLTENRVLTSGTFPQESTKRHKLFGFLSRKR